MNKVTVVVFGDEKKAYEGLSAIRDLHQEGSLTMYADAVMVKDAGGKVEVRRAAPDPSPLGTLSGFTVGSLVGLLGGPIGVAVAAGTGTMLGAAWDLTQAEIGNDFIAEVSEFLLPGKAAVVCEMDEDWQTPLEVAAATPGLAGADLRNLVNEAALLAAHRGQDQVRQEEFLDALEKIMLGPERPLLLSREDRERVAYHEGGHAILGLVVPGSDPVHRVSIVPRGQALGVTYQRSYNERYNYPEGYLRARIVGMLGGRAAEEVVYGTRTTGAENDIEQATQLARSMVTRWGMSDALGMVQLAPRQNPYLGTIPGYETRLPISEDTARAIDAEVRRIIEESHDEAIRLLLEHRAELDALAVALLQRETLDQEEILEVTGLRPAPELMSGARANRDGSGVDAGAKQVATLPRDERTVPT